jgi:hypothetical protein
MKIQINVDGELRDMTDDELVQYKLDQKENARLKEADDARANAKLALLERLGMTTDEINLLLQ